MGSPTFESPFSSFSRHGQPSGRFDVVVINFPWAMLVDNVQDGGDCC